jgi:flagellar hook-length control protein FliK
MAAESISGAGTPPGTTTLAGAPPAGAPPSGGAQMTDVFMQLFAGMVNATTGTVQTAVPTTPQDLAVGAFDGAAEPLLEISDTGTDTDTDTHTDDTDADSDEAGALAVAALLPGIMTTPAPTSGSAPQGPDDAALTALTTARVAVDVSSAAVDDLADDTADAAGNTPTAATDASAATSQNAPTSGAHMHALLNSHAVANADATDVAVQSPVGSPDWKDELGTHLTWMAVNGHEAASLRLSPDHLGPLEVRISVDDGKASVYFGAANADTRSALEQSLPRLREMFASQGLVLADAGVSRDAPRNQFKPAATSSAARGTSDAGAAVAVSSVTLARMGLIDTYV